MAATAIFAINDLSSILNLNKISEIFTAPSTGVFHAPKMNGARLSDDREIFDCDYFVLPNGRMVVDHNILYLTDDNRYVPAGYPKAWPYEQFTKPGSDTLFVDEASYDIQRIPGVWFAPCNTPATSHLYHNLIDNMARLHFIDALTDYQDLGSEINVAIAQLGVSSIDMRILQNACLRGKKFRIFPRGIYEFERLIVPPLSNKNDYIMVAPTQFLAERLSALVKRPQTSYPTRIYVSRADTCVRNLSNDRELAGELGKLGFLAMCPGEFSITTQLEMFAAAEIIVGILGMGLTPALVARKCRALLEFEALGWPTTPFSGIATAMGIAHQFLPCKLVERDREGVFDWLAEADIPLTLEIVRQVLDQ
jgi:hypothetical protein